MSAVYDKFKKEAEEKLACLSHIQMKLKCLRHYDEYNDWRRLRTAVYEIDEEIKRDRGLIETLKTVFDNYGSFTEEMADGYIRSFRAAVVYYELFYERAARWDLAAYNYSRCLNYERALGKRCAPADPSHLNLFKKIAFDDAGAIDRVLLAEEEFLKKERELTPPAGKPDKSLPYKL